MTILTDELIEKAARALTAHDVAETGRQFSHPVYLGKARAALEAVLPDIVPMPAIPTRELLWIIAKHEWPSDWEEGKRLQIAHGLSTIPPRTELEWAAGQYMRLREAIRNLSPKQKD